MNLFLTVAAALMLSGVANGGIIIDFDQSASGSLGTVNLPGGVTGMMIQGTADSGALLNFTGTEQLTSPSSGQARIEAVDGAFTYLDIRFDNGNLFDRIVFNLNSSNDGNITVTAYDQFLTAFTQVLTMGSSGQNFINVLASGGSHISSVNFQSSGNPSALITDIAQVRVNNLEGTSIEINSAVPEPTTLGMMGLGLAGLLLARRKRR